MKHLPVQLKQDCLAYEEGDFGDGQCLRLLQLLSISGRKFSEGGKYKSIGKTHLPETSTVQQVTELTKKKKKKSREPTQLTVY